MSRTLPFRAVVLLASLTLIAAFAANLLLGDRVIAPAEAWRALTAPDGSETHLILRAIRLPRSLMAIEVGAALALSGALMQALTRNPLADPGLFGINAGAGFLILLATSLFGLSGLSGLIWFALAGAALGAAAGWLVASAPGHEAGPVTLTLSGIAVAAVLTGLSTALALWDPAAFDRLRHWSAGTLGGASLASVRFALPFLLLGLMLAAGSARALNALALGDALAQSLGAHLWRLRAGGLMAILLLAGTATAIAGPVAFVGLVAPHLVRRVSGPDMPRLLLGSALVGPVLVLLADLAGRVILPMGEVPVSIVTAFLGAPFLILLARGRLA